MEGEEEEEGEEGGELEVEVVWLHLRQSHPPPQRTLHSISSWQVWLAASAVPSWNQAATRRRPCPDASLSGVKQSSQGNSNGGHLHPPIHRLDGSVEKREDQRHTYHFNVWPLAYCVIRVVSGDVAMPRWARGIL